MKKIILLIFSSILLLGFVGCSSNEENSKEPVENDTVVETEENTNDDSDTESEDTKEENSTSDSFNFTDFELEVDYAENKEYEAEYELNNGSIEAEIEDDLNNVKLKDEEAFNKLKPMLEELNIEQDTPKEDAINEALTVFELPDDYIKFDLEITFENGTKIEFKDEK